MRIVGKTDIGRCRAENQDIFRAGYLHDNGGWGIVCDGMGGAQNGKLASNVAVECIENYLLEHLAACETAAEIEQVLRDGLEAANKQVFERSGNGMHQMGTTAVCAVVKDDLLHLAHVGDSRAYIYEGIGEDGEQLSKEEVERRELPSGRLRQLTRDHSMVQELVDQGALTLSQARKHPEKNVITRALGVDKRVDAAYSCRPIQNGAIVLLCSDGLTNMVNPERIAEMIAGFDFFDLPVELVNDALLAGGNDNITVLLMQPVTRRTADGQTGN